ncbi:hypothetical protein LCGC14_1648860 [marine sediment metagenome]|uniref:Uncharacterized protein n=1 Tax=marine sediment metagenome TaxID=412755 RepID=A0A0F9HYB1_9ZZZZ
MELILRLVSDFLVILNLIQRFLKIFQELQNIPQLKMILSIQLKI